MKFVKACLALVFVCALPACRDDAALQQRAEQQQLSEQLTQLESRVVALERKPRLDFAITGKQLSIEEKMFTPMLNAEANLKVKGDNMPPTFYVDVMLKVQVESIKYEAVERQIFPVVDGKSRIALQQTLPQHGLKLEQIKVTLKPMTWYRGQIISDDMVNYQ